MNQRVALAFVLICTFAPQLVSPVAAVETTTDNPYRVKDIGPNELVQPLVAVGNRVFFGQTTGSTAASFSFRTAARRVHTWSKT